MLLRDFSFMKQTIDTVVVGGGLAGACAAFHLSRHQHVALLEAEEPASQASGAAAGLVNPLMGRRPRLVWRAHEALSALRETLAAAGASDLFRDDGVVRPALSDKHADLFRRAAAEHPDHAAWLEADIVRERYPAVHVHEGALLVRESGAVRVPDMVTSLLDAARKNGAVIHTHTRAVSWREDDRQAYVEAQRDDAPLQLRARRIILALGRGYEHFDEFRPLPLKQIKGQTLRIRRPEKTPSLPFLSGSGYVVSEGDTLVVGSSYEHSFDDLEPSAEQTAYILKKTTRMVPALAGAPVLDAQAGVRVKVPQSRYPLLGPLPGRQRIWVFTGLGSKGLLTAPMLARQLPHCLEHPRALPAEVGLDLG